MEQYQEVNPSNSQKGRKWSGAFSSEAGLEDSGGLKSHSPVLALQRCLWQSNPDPATPQNLSPAADRCQLCCPRNFQEWLIGKPSRQSSPSAVIQEQYLKFILCLSGSFPESVYSSQKDSRFIAVYQLCHYTLKSVAKSPIIFWD